MTKNESVPVPRFLFRRCDSTIGDEALIGYSAVTVLQQEWWFDESPAVWAVEGDIQSMSRRANGFSVSWSSC